MKKLITIFLICLTQYSIGQVIPQRITVLNSAGGSGTNKVDSATTSNDSLYYWINGSKHFGGLVGSGGSVSGITKLGNSPFGLVKLNDSTYYVDSTVILTKLMAANLYYPASGNPSNFLQSITGYIVEGSGVTITGTGTSIDPYVINATGGGSGSNGGRYIIHDYGIIVDSSVANQYKISVDSATLKDIHYLKKPIYADGDTTKFNSDYERDTLLNLAGGATGQALIKNSSTNGDWSWATVGGGSPIDTTNLSKRIDTAYSNIAANGSAISTNTTAIAGKQAILVSGTNLKTINGNSLLGSGDLAISGGGSGGGIDSVRYKIGTDSLNYYKAGTTTLAARTQRVFNVKDYGAVGDNSTNNDSAFARCVRDIVAAKAGVMYFPNGTYIGRIVLPYISGASYLPIEIRGETPPVQLFGTVNDSTYVLPDNGVIIKSNATSGSAVISATGSGGVFSLISVTIKNIQVRTYDNPQIDGIDMTWASHMEINNVFINTGAYASNTVFPSYGKTGLLTPTYNNAGALPIYNLTVTGYYNGITLNEHVEGRGVHLYGNYNGMKVLTSVHGLNINRVDMGRNVNNIYIAGSARINIEQFDIETVDSSLGRNSKSYWQVPAYDVKDTALLGNGNITWVNTRAYIGTIHTLSVTPNCPIVFRELGEKNIGIGTISPKYSIDDSTANPIFRLNGNLLNSYSGLMFSNQGTKYWYLGDNFDVNNQRNFRLYDYANSKNILFSYGGILNLGGSNPASTATAAISIDNFGQVNVLNGLFIAPTSVIATLSGSAINGGNLVLQGSTYGNGKVLFGTSGYNIATQRLGIGTNAPGGDLEINTNSPNISLNSKIANAATYIGFSKIGVAKFYISLDNNSNGTNDFLIKDATNSKVRFYINTTGDTYIGNAADNTTTSVMGFLASGGIKVQNTNAGTTGAQTINKPVGSVQFAAAASTLVVTNSLATTSSNIFVQVEGTDATAISARVTKAAGSFTITLNAAATSTTTVSFWVIN